MVGDKEENWTEEIYPLGGRIVCEIQLQYRDYLVAIQQWIGLGESLLSTDWKYDCVAIYHSRPLLKNAGEMEYGVQPDGREINGLKKTALRGDRSFCIV